MWRALTNQNKRRAYLANQVCCITLSFPRQPPMHVLARKKSGRELCCFSAIQCSMYIVWRLTVSTSWNVWNFFYRKWLPVLFIQQTVHLFESRTRKVPNLLKRNITARSVIKSPYYRHFIFNTQCRCVFSAWNKECTSTLYKQWHSYRWSLLEFELFSPWCYLT